MREDFNAYRQRKQEERRKIVADAQKVSTIYKEMIQSSVDDETELPRDAPIVNFMGWLADELATLSDHMAVGREYASMISLHAFA